MKILIVSPKFYPIIGGGETYILNSVKKLHAAGIDVSIAVEPNNERNLADFEFPVYEIDGLSDDVLDPVKAADGLYELFSELQPELIHVHGYFGLMSVALANSKNIPLIVSVHSTPVWNERIFGRMSSFENELTFARKVLDLAKPKLFLAANSVYADAGEKIVESRSQVLLLPYPVDTVFFQNKSDTKWRQEFGLSDTDILIVVPSRIIERKGIKEAVLALEQLPDNYYLCLPSAKNPLDKVYWHGICSHPLFSRIKSRVLIPKKDVLYEDMPALYASSNIVLMPSYYEGAPLATVEAMASGTPFIGADSQGINGFIHNNINGLLVPKKAITELAQAIILLSKDKTLQVRLSLHATQDIKYLSWDEQLPKLMRIYSDIIDKV